MKESDKEDNYFVVDAHCHLDFKQFNKDREPVIQRARDCGVKLMINSGVDISTNQRSLELAKMHDFISVTLGLSPNTLDGQSDEVIYHRLMQIRNNAGFAVGIGEAGLDYYHYRDLGSRERQAHVFRQIIDLAVSLDLPLVIHSRDAEQQALEMVKNLDKIIFHCYSGTLETMKEAVDRGFYISLATNLCRSGHHQILAKNVPLDHLLVETDSPFRSPRKGRNEPAHVLESVKLIAKIRNLEPREIAQLTTDNVRRIYKLD